MSHNSFTSQSVTILLFNCNGFWRRKDEIDIVLRTQRIDIVLLTETHFSQNDRTPNVQGYKCYMADHPDGSAHAGSAILIRSLPAESNHYVIHTINCDIFKI
jgi:exonuclease III